MTYEYKCKHCGYVWEKEQGIKDDAIKKCPKCKNQSAQRLISGGTAFHLKGGSWSNNGYSG